MLTLHYHTNSATLNFRTSYTTSDQLPQILLYRYEYKNIIVLFLK